MSFYGFLNLALGASADNEPVGIGVQRCEVEDVAGRMERRDGALYLVFKVAGEAE